MLKAKSMVIKPRGAINVSGLNGFLKNSFKNKYLNKKIITVIIEAINMAFWSANSVIFVENPKIRKKNTLNTKVNSITIFLNCGSSNFKLALFKYLSILPLPIKSELLRNNPKSKIKINGEKW